MIRRQSSSTPEPDQPTDSPEPDEAASLRRFALRYLALYLIFILAMTLILFPIDHPGYNLRPFRSMIHDWRAGGRDLMVNFLGNMVAFVPFGVLIPLSRRRATSWWTVVFLCALLSVAIEAMQLASGRRVADVDDVLLNAAGGLAGFAFLRAIRRAVEGPAA